MFKQMQNIDSAFRYIRFFTMAVVLGAFSLCIFVIYRSYVLASVSQQRVYVLVNGKALEAYASDRKDNIPVEAKDHIRTFHQLFFTLSPDEKSINDNLTRSFYLADITAKQQFDNLTESNYYSNIISGNVNQTIRVDSVQLDLNQYPFYFRCFSTQQLTRMTSVVDRNLITEGYLRNVSRSENNSHGFLIEKWKIIENRDLRIRKR